MGFVGIVIYFYVTCCLLVPDITYASVTTIYFCQFRVAELYLFCFLLFMLDVCQFGFTFFSIDSPARAGRASNGASQWEGKRASCAACVVELACAAAPSAAAAAGGSGRRIWRSRCQPIRLGACRLWLGPWAALCETGWAQYAFLMTTFHQFSNSHPPPIS